MPSNSRFRQWAVRTYKRLPEGMREPALRVALRLGKRVDRSADPNALLSVIMPVHNVEAYLAEAVQSVLSQSYRNLELILVDDGSTDTSGQMCDEFAAQDERIRVIHQPNAGLGAARNTGIAAARGLFIAFADSDDYLLPGAYETMLGSLLRSGSDVVTGNVQRRQGSHLFQAWNQSRSHVFDKRGVSLRDVPDLVFDTVAWNKIYRKKFWDEYPKGFPVGELYEDMVPVFTAFLNAKSIDIVAKPVYVWRLRDEGNSITQRLMEPDNITHRFKMLDQIKDMIEEHQLGATVADRFALKVLEGDLWIYVREMAGADAEVTALIEQETRTYWTSAPDSSKAGIVPERRISYWLLEHGRGGEVVRFREWYDSISTAPPTVSVDGALLLDVSSCPVPLDGIPSLHLDLGRTAEGVADVTGIGWSAPGVLAVRGYAYTRFVSRGEQEITLVATERGSGATVTFSTRRADSMLAARWARETYLPRDHDDYVCDIDVRALAARATLGHGKSVWTLAARIVDGDIVRDVPLDRAWRGGSAAVVTPYVLDGGVVASVDTSGREPARIAFDNKGVVATSFEVDGDEVRCGFAAERGVSKVVLVRADAPRQRINAVRSGAGFVAKLPTTADTQQAVWRLRAKAHGHELPVFAPAGFTQELTANAAGLRPVVEPSGAAVVHRYLCTAVVDGVDVSADGELEVRGALFGGGGVELGIAPVGAQAIVWQPVQLTDGRFTCRLATSRPDHLGVPRPLPTGGYRLVGRNAAAGHADVAVIWFEPTIAGLSATHVTSINKIKLSRAHPALIAIDISAPIPDELLGRYAQAELIRTHGAPERELEDAVFFCVDLGSNAADSALAIHHELRRRDSGLRLYWGVEDLSVPVPEGGIPVLKLSPEWYARLNASRYVVNNYGGIWGLAKADGQRYLQTWHGTPLKYIGVSEVRHRNGSNSNLDQIAAEAADWDAFVSPSPYMSALVPTELLFNGPLIESGYPRNDRLVTAGPGERATLRAMLGVPDEAKVLLYAPTFRESDRHGWTAALFDALDLNRLLDLLGPEWYVLLRGHSFVARDDRTDRSAGRLVDVTQHPDVNDLYLAADALVTDYSSVMFDFAVTGKPMAFFVPDLTQYRAARGMYFDLAQTAPGPLHQDVAHLAEGLRDLPALQAEYAERYAAFRRRFNPWEDGKAAARVVDAFFA